MSEENTSREDQDEETALVANMWLANIDGDVARTEELVLVAPDMFRNPDIAYYLASARYQQRRFSEARSQLTRVLDEHPDYFNARLLLARMEYDEGHSDAAVRQIEQAIGLGMDRARAYLLLGHYLHEVGSDREAVAAFEKIQSESSCYRDAMLGFAGIYRSENKKMAHDYLVRASSFDPNSIQTELAWISLLLDQNKLGEARNKINALSERCDLRIRLEIARGYLDFLEKNFDSSIKRFTHLISIAPYRSDVYVDRARSLISMRRFKEAAEDLDLVDQLGGNILLALALRGRIEFMQFHLIGATKILLRCLKVGEGNEGQTNKLVHLQDPPYV